MSQVLINQYLAKRDPIKKIGGSVHPRQRDRFADYKEKVIDLLARVTTVSVETMKIVDAMRGSAR